MSGIAANTLSPAYALRWAVIIHSVIHYFLPTLLQEGPYLAQLFLERAVA